MILIISKSAIERFYVYGIMSIFCLVVLLDARIFEGLRIIQQIAKAVLLLSYGMAMLNVFVKDYGRFSLFRMVLFLFIFMLFSYGIISNHPDQLIPILSSLLVYYFFYYYTIQGIITEKLFKKFVLTYLGVAVFLYIDTFMYKFSYLDSLADSGGMNVGYDLLAFMLLAMSFYKEPKWLLLIAIAYVLVLFSLKRGAVVCATMILFPLLWEYIHSFRGKKRIMVNILIMILLMIGVSILLLYQDILFHRFSSDSLNSGSGRNIIYSTIYNKYISLDIGRLCFGNGFFAAADIPYWGVQNVEGYYAHSDLYELLWDHGLLGIVLYALLLLALICYPYRGFINKILWIFVAVWLIKAYASGVYTTLNGRVFFIVIGYWMGISNYMLLKKKC